MEDVIFRRNISPIFYISNGVN